jgi:uncharacterized protein (TIGR00661 family)
VVYGLGREETIGKLTLKGFSEQGFVDDLAASRGVIANGGLSLMNEAVSLRKPFFSVPVENQYEQVLNAFYLRKLGYGAWAERLGVDDLRAWAAKIPDYAANLLTFEHDANARLFATVDRVLEEFEAQAFHAELRRPAVTRG